MKLKHIHIWFPTKRKNYFNCACAARLYTGTLGNHIKLAK